MRDTDFAVSTSTASDRQPLDRATAFAVLHDLTIAGDDPATSADARPTATTRVGMNGRFQPSPPTA